MAKDEQRNIAKLIYWILGAMVLIIAGLSSVGATYVIEKVNTFDNQLAEKGAKISSLEEWRVSYKDDKSEWTKRFDRLEDKMDRILKDHKAHENARSGE